MQIILKLTNLVVDLNIVRLTLMNRVNNGITSNITKVIIEEI